MGIHNLSRYDLTRVIGGSVRHGLSGDTQRVAGTCVDAPHGGDFQGATDDCRHENSRRFRCGGNSLLSQEATDVSSGYRNLDCRDLCR